jgi:hypothetical protein
MSKCSDTTNNRTVMRIVGPAGVFPCSEHVLEELGPDANSVDMAAVIDPDTGEVVEVVRYERARPQLVCELDGCNRPAEHHHAAAGSILCADCLCAATGADGRAAAGVA